MSEVPLYFDAWRPSRRFEEPLYKGSSLTSKHPPLGPFRGPMPGALWWFWGGGGPSCERGAPVQNRVAVTRVQIGLTWGSSPNEV